MSGRLVVAGTTSYLGPLMRPPRTLIAAACAGAALLAGCSSSGGGTSTATTAPATSAPGSSGPTAGGTTASTLFTTGQVPAVSGATDLSKEPSISAGNGTPPTVLTGKDLVVGTGPVAGADSSVKVQYVGALYDTGKVFDASWTDSGPTSFSLNGVIPGFKDAIIGMHVGGRREIVIPPKEGYGAAGSPPVIPPNSTLVFVIDLLGVS